MREKQGRFEKWRGRFSPTTPPFSTSIDSPQQILSHFVIFFADVVSAWCGSLRLTVIIIPKIAVGGDIIGSLHMASTCCKLQSMHLLKEAVPSRNTTAAIGHIYHSWTTNDLRLRTWGVVFV